MSWLIELLVGEGCEGCFPVAITGSVTVYDLR